ncbi:MAG TPA: class I SAM-dependent methyltransferase [Steroidobacteraceae bacterium]|jgi:SAM-dependent methyltransferase|nr:class I SAM-dependent methyltransferase [Steroidobacteraceae bacterium]
MNAEAATLAALVAASSAYYRPAGQFAWRFARGKLAGDPAFRALLAQGLLSGRHDILDLGCGQGLLAAWLLAAHAVHARGRAWPSAWPAPPQLRSYVGVELSPPEVRRARRAFAADAGARLQVLHGDILHVDYGSPDAVIIMDVLHYLDYPAQERVLEKVRAALRPEGLLLMRVGDAAGGLGFAFSKAFDRTVALMRRGAWRPLRCRPLPDWRELLSRQGFRAREQPMSAGTPFVNTLLVAQAA